MYAHALYLILLISFSLHAEKQEVHLGVNLSSVVDWSSEWVFKDAFKSARPWMNAENIEENQLSTEGWPLYIKPQQSFETLLRRGLHGHYPGGIYVCSYEGKGRLNLRFDARVLSEETGRIRLLVSPSSDGIFVEIKESDPRDPIRAIRLIPEEYVNMEAQEPFHPLFIDKLKPFQVLRFMDWQRMNNSSIAEWSDRSLPTDYTQATPKGVALEHIITLCNQAQKDPWICIPHRASDDYVHQCAQLIEQKLNPERKIYLEYSNEVWNSSFQQARYASEQGQKKALSTNAYEAQLRFYSERAVEVFKIFQQAFGEKERLVKVMGSQAVNSWVSHTVLQWKNAHEHVDALAIAPYFGSELGHPNQTDKVLSQTVEETLDHCENEIQQIGKAIREQKKVTDQYQVELIAYEAGQHLSGYLGAENTKPLTDHFIDCNRSERMEELYLKDYLSWIENGGGLFVYYHSISTPSKWGSWGLLEYQDQESDSSPKYRGVLKIYFDH